MIVAGDLGRATSGSIGSRHITEAEALRAMQRLCQKVAAQKMLVISSLENDCSKEDLNHQIAVSICLFIFISFFNFSLISFIMLMKQVLQELQRKYVRLEMALQYSNFDNKTNSRSRSIMVTPIHETPYVGSDGETTDNLISDEALTDDTCNEGSYSTGRLTTLRVVKTDPLQQRLKDEIEGSDNVSTSNDELIVSESDVLENNTWSTNVRDPLQDMNQNTNEANSADILNTRMSLVDLQLFNSTSVSTISIIN